MPERLRERSCGAGRCRSLAGCKKRNVELRDAGEWNVVKNLMWS